MVLGTYLLFGSLDQQELEGPNDPQTWGHVPHPIVTYDPNMGYGP